MISLYYRHFSGDLLSPSCGPKLASKISQGMINYALCAICKHYNIMILCNEIFSYKILTYVYEIITYYIYALYASLVSYRLQIYF